MTVTSIKSTNATARPMGFHSRRTVLLAAGMALAVLVAACNTAPPPKAEGTQLSNAELQALYLSGRRTVSQGISVASGREWKITRNGAGAQSLAMVNSDFTDTGTYRIEGNMVCSKWMKVREGAEACNAVYRMPDGKYQSANAKGEKTSDFTVTAGS